MRKELPLLITAATGIFMALSRFVTHPHFKALEGVLVDWSLIVIVFSMILGVINLIAVNVGKIRRAQAGWGYALLILVGFSITTLVGLLNLGSDQALPSLVLNDHPALLSEATTAQINKDYPELTPRQQALLHTMALRYLHPTTHPDESSLAAQGVSETDLHSLLAIRKPNEETLRRLRLPLSAQDIQGVAEKARKQSLTLLREIIPPLQQWQGRIGSRLDELRANEELTSALSQPPTIPEDTSWYLGMLHRHASVKGRLPIPWDDALLAHVAHDLTEQAAERDERDAVSRSPWKGLSAPGVFSTLRQQASLQESLRRELLARPGLNSPLADEATTILLTSPGLRLHLATLDDGSWFQWIFHTIFYPLSSTMFALLAFFIASAAYRAFRAHSLHATLLLTAGVIVMFGQIPLGDSLTAFLPPDWRVSQLSEWIIAVPNMAAQRAIMIGVALGAASTALKLILGIERGYLGHD